MDFGTAGALENACGVLRRHTAAGEDDDAALGATVQLAKLVRALLGRRRLAGGEDAVAAQADDLLQRLERVPAAVESAVESDACAVGNNGDKVFHLGDVDVPVGGQAADDDTVRAEGQGRFDLQRHQVGFLGGIDEIAQPRADEDVDGQLRIALPDGPEPGHGRGEAVEFEVRAQFDAPGASGDGGINTFQIAAADFQQGHPLPLQVALDELALHLGTIGVFAHVNAVQEVQVGTLEEGGFGRRADVAGLVHRLLRDD